MNNEIQAHISYRAQALDHVGERYTNIPLRVVRDALVVFFAWLEIGCIEANTLPLKPFQQFENYKRDGNCCGVLHDQ